MLVGERSAHQTTPVTVVGFGPSVIPVHRYEAAEAGIGMGPPTLPRPLQLGPDHGIRAVAFFTK